jgi:hypothetical protein
MGDSVAFNARYVLTGASDIKTSGASMKSAFEALDAAWHPIVNFEANSPAGPDEAGAEFDGWYKPMKKDIIDMGKEISGYVVDIARNTELAIASFVKADLDSANDLKIEDL